MTHKGDKCYTCSREEMIDALRSGGVLRWWKFGPMIYNNGRELHPRRDTVIRLINDKTLAESADANETQRQCGESTYRLRELAGEER